MICPVVLKHGRDMTRPCRNKPSPRRWRCCRDDRVICVMTMIMYWISERALIRSKHHFLHLGFVSPCIIIHSNKSNEPDASISQIYCSSFKYSRRPARPRPTTLLPPRSNGKLEAATAVYKLLMMGTTMPETCWAVFKRRAINLRDWCIWFVWFIWMYDGARTYKP